MILAIDTATDQAGVSILADEVILAEFAWRTRGNHSRQLPRAIDAVLATSGASIQDVTRVAVAIGPGSFNGIRVGIAHSKGLAFALGATLMGISTLDIIGRQSAQVSCPVLAILSAGRHEVYLATYDGFGVEWRRSSAYQLLTVSAAAERYGEQYLLAGSGAEAVAYAARTLNLEPITAGVGGRLRRPGYLAELGWTYFEDGGEDQLHTLRPLYLRKSSAEEKRDATVLSNNS